MAVTVKLCVVLVCQPSLVNMDADDCIISDLIFFNVTIIYLLLFVIEMIHNRLMKKYFEIFFMGGMYFFFILTFFNLCRTNQWPITFFYLAITRIQISNKFRHYLFLTYFATHNDRH